MRAWGHSWATMLWGAQLWSGGGRGEGSSNEARQHGSAARGRPPRSERERPARADRGFRGGSEGGAAPPHRADAVRADAAPAGRVVLRLRGRGRRLAGVRAAAGGRASRLAAGPAAAVL